MEKEVEWVRIWMMFEDGTFWASKDKYERIIAEIHLVALSQGMEWPEQPNKRVVRAILV